MDNPVCAVVFPPCVLLLVAGDDTPGVAALAVRYFGRFGEEIVLTGDGVAFGDAVDLLVVDADGELGEEVDVDDDEEEEQEEEQES